MNILDILKHQSKDRTDYSKVIISSMRLNKRGVLLIIALVTCHFIATYGFYSFNHDTSIGIIGFVTILIVAITCGMLSGLLMAMFNFISTTSAFVLVDSSTFSILLSSPMPYVGISVQLILAVIIGLVSDLYRQLLITQKALKDEHERTIILLHNILPVTIAEQLKLNPVSIAENYPNSTTLFSDIVGFTTLAHEFTPRKLVDFLNDIFTEFDKLTEKYHLEKIKTIGDAYMAVAGLPEPRLDHAEVMADMALEMVNVIKTVKESYKKQIDIRIGIDSGPVIGGVIGTKKFSYDLWGNSVNIAARMESHGMPGKIQVAEKTYDLLKGKYAFEKRGIIDIKGMGPMSTFLLLNKLSTNLTTM